MIQLQSFVNRPNLDNLLKKHMLRRVAVAGDGNCLFHSMCVFFKKFGYTQDRMRKLICDYIEKNKDIFHESIANLPEYKSMEHYLHSMRSNGHWGDGICLQAFGLLFQINVVLFMPTGIYQMHDKYTKNVAFIRNGNHYEAAIPQ